MTTSAPERLELVDALPDYRFRERHHRHVDMSVDHAWRSALDVRPDEIRVLGPLMAIRTLPGRVMGRPPADAGDRSLLEHFVDEGFVPLRVDETPHDGRAIAIYGAAGRFWSPAENAPHHFDGVDDFLTFDRPEHAQLAFSLEVVEQDDGGVDVITETRVGGTDERAIRKFAPYWALIRLPSGLIRRSWLAAIDRRSHGDDRPPRWRDVWPRRAEGLPPGQREVAVMPRFTDDPRRPPPPVPEHPTLTIRYGGRTMAELDLDDLRAIGEREVVADFHCVTTWTARDRHWRGVPFRPVVDRAFGEAPLPPFLTAHAADGARAVYRTEDLAEALIATELGGEPLDLRHGAPLRLVSPSQYGYKNVKHLVALEFADDEPTSAYGPKEHLRARVALEERHARFPNWLIRWPYRMLVPVTARLAERSLRQGAQERP